MGAPALIPSLIPMFVVAAMRRAEYRIHRQLVDAHAFTAETAISLSLSRSMDGRRLQALTAGGAVRTNAAGLHFLDADGWSAYQDRRRGRIAMALCVALVVVGIVVAVVATR